MPSSIVKVISDFERGLSAKTFDKTQFEDPSKFFQTHYVPSAVNVIRPARKDFGYAVPVKRGHGFVAGKTIVSPRSAAAKEATADDLLQLIKTRYAFLLKPTADGTGFVIDTTPLNEIKMRKRYLPLGLKVTVDKALTSVQVSEVAAPAVAASVNVNQIAQIAITVFALIVNVCMQIYNAIAPAFGVVTAQALDPVDINPPRPSRRCSGPSRWACPSSWSAWTPTCLATATCSTT